MRLAQIFTKTTKENPKDEVSINAQLLERGGFIYKNSAGVYTYLPLGWRVMQKIIQIVREEINNIGGQELCMPALVERRYLDTTGRWDVEIGYEVYGKNDNEAHHTLGWTHEEVMTEITSRYVSSYKDLPFSAYQFQTKFRNEPRAKAGILRGREFMMKDLYSFHATEPDMMIFYNEVKEAYQKIFERCGLRAYYTVAGGGAFTANTTHEFQVLTPAGEDTIILCPVCHHAENTEITKFKAGDPCPNCTTPMALEKSIEVGNIFPLGTKYSQAFHLTYTDENGAQQLVVMGSYGIGIGRLMGTIVEVHHDDKGIIWPPSVAPFQIHLIALEGAETAADNLYHQLIQEGLEVLYDDRVNTSAGEKFADADLLGIPQRLVMSKKTLESQAAEFKLRHESESKLLPLSDILAELRAKKI